MNNFANVTVTTQCFPADGLGAVSAIRGTASAGGTTTYTNNTATDTAAGVPWAGTVPGDYAFTADGYWGIVVSYSGVTLNSVLTVDRWRKPGRPGGGELWVPASGGATTVHSTVHLAGQPYAVLKRVICLTPAAATFTITDAKGIAFSNFVFQGAAAVAASVVADYGDGIVFNQPFGMIASGGKWQVVYAVGFGPSTR